MADLKTNYVDDELDLTKNTNRKYILRDADGNILHEGISIEEVTEFVREGSRYGAADINATNEAVNTLNDDLEEVKKMSGLPFLDYDNPIKTITGTETWVATEDCYISGSMSNHGAYVKVDKCTIAIAGSWSMYGSWYASGNYTVIPLRRIKKGQTVICNGVGEVDFVKELEV